MSCTLLSVSVFIGILLTRHRVPYHSVICRFHCSVHGIIVAERSLKRDSFLIGTNWALAKKKKYWNLMVNIWTASMGSWRLSVSNRKLCVKGESEVNSFRYILFTTFLTGLRLHIFFCPNVNPDLLIYLHTFMEQEVSYNIY